MSVSDSFTQSGQETDFDSLREALLEAVKSLQTSNLLIEPANSFVDVLMDSVNDGSISKPVASFLIRGFTASILGRFHKNVLLDPLCSCFQRTLLDHLKPNYSGKDAEQRIVLKIHNLNDKNMSVFEQTEPLGESLISNNVAIVLQRITQLAYDGCVLGADATYVMNISKGVGVKNNDVRSPIIANDCMPTG